MTTQRKRLLPITRKYTSAHDGKPHEEVVGWLFWCQGCEETHGFYVKQAGPHEAVWSYNHDPDNPSVSPSIVTTGGKVKHCHLFLRNGRIEYLGDCKHALAGTTVDLIAEPSS